MAIYKSSFNQRPNKNEKEKQEKEKPVKIKPIKEKPKKPKAKVNVALICFFVFLALFIVCLPPNFLKSFILGMVGLLVYPVCIIGMFFSAVKLSKKQYEIKTRYLVYLAISLTLIWFIFHLILTSRLDANSYGSFLKQTYLAKTTAGGLLFSLISYPVTKLLTIVGAYIFTAIALAIFVGLIVDYVIVDKQVGHSKKSKFNFSEIESFENELELQVKEEKVNQTQTDNQKEVARRRLGLEKGETTILSSSMPNYNINSRPQSKPMSKRDYILTPIEPVIPPENSNDIFLDNQTGMYNSKKINKEQISNYAPYNSNIYAQPTANKNDFSNQADSQADNYNDTGRFNEENLNQTNKFSQNSFNQASNYSENSNQAALGQEFSEEIKPINSLESYAEQPTSVTKNETDEYNDIFAENDGYEEFEPQAEIEEDNSYSSTEQFEEETAVESEDVFNDMADLSTEQTKAQTSFDEINANITESDFVDEYAQQEDSSNLGSTVESEVVMPSVPSVDISKFKLPNSKPIASQQVEQVKLDDIKPKQEIPPYVAPPVQILKYMENVKQISEDELQENVTRLEQVLEDFKVPAKVNNVQVGPAVTRYELTMPRGISVNKIVQMSDDIAMTLASNGAIRVEAPIPGKNSVGIEVPNNQVSPVSLRELIDSEEFKVRANPLSFVLGKDINGDIIFCNLDKMPHLLVAGSTGSGKSVCLNTMLLSMCYKAGPQALRLILVDPKMVEFSTYSGLPHLLIPEVITGKEMTINALDWSIKEMERRYALFAKNHVVNINEFNKSEAVRFKREDKLPFIVIVVDELADLMLEAKREIEDRIAKLAAKARAAGIHLVLATQRPSVDVITGTVKANLPSRIAFALTNYMDSKTVLDGGGAEKLLGKGDMLFKPQDKPEPRRVQGAFVSNEEISKVVEYIKEHNKPVYDDDTGKAIKNPYKDNGNAGGNASGGTNQEFDPVLKDALYMFIEAKQASGSMISRRYSVGFNRAGRIMDQMFQAGFIGPPDGSKPRQVLISMDEYNAIFGNKN